MEKVVLGKNTKYLRSEAFKDTNIKEFYIEGNEAPYCYPNVFSNVTLSNATLFVSDNNIEFCQTNEPWKSFGKILTLEGNEPMVKPIVCATPVVTYENGELHFSCETEGAIYHYNIQLSQELSGESTGVAKLPESFTILVTAYTTAEGYEPSEITTASFAISVDDINGDGEVNIGDVTTLVNKILQKDVSA